MAAISTPAWPQAQPAAAGNLVLTQGTDAPSGIAWARIAVAASTVEPAWTDGMIPALIVECSQSHQRRSLDLFLDFGSADAKFHPPPPPDPHALPNPSETLTFLFEGFRPFRRSWELMPSGELRYRNPGFGTSNLESARFFLQYMYTVKQTRVLFRNGSSQVTATFPTFDFVEQVRKTPLCQ